MTDAGLRHLEDIPSLQYVSIIATKVTAAGIARLRKALPHCEIID